MKVRSINSSMERIADEVRDVVPKCEWIAVIYAIDDEVTTAFVRAKYADDITTLIGALERVKHTLLGHSCSGQ